MTRLWMDAFGAWLQSNHNPLLLTVLTLTIALILYSCQLLSWTFGCIGKVVRSLCNFRSTTRSHPEEEIPGVWFERYPSTSPRITKGGAILTELTTVQVAGAGDSENQSKPKEGIDTSSFKFLRKELDIDPEAGDC